MKSKTKMIILLIALVAFGFLSSPAKEKSDKTKATLGLNKTTTAVSKALMNANRATCWTEGDGFFNWEIQNSWNGEYPKQAGVGCIYSEGIVFGGICNDGLYSEQLRITGNTYFHGMRPGKILTNASGRSIAPEDIAPASVRCYGVRPDMPPGVTKMPDLTTDAATFFQVTTPTPAQIQTIADRYFLDWKEWPASSGAPWYIDTIGTIHNDAAYDPTNPHHIPGIPGATKTIWYVCNDLDPAVSQTFAGSPPMGIEQQMTLWAYASSTPLNEIIFKQVKLIYKGNPGAPATSKIDSMYIVQWSDPDNGDAGDDFAGCDSTLNIGYVYNSTTSDAKFAAKGLPAPAAGFVFLQGASYTSSDPNDSAVVNFRWRKGQKYFHERPLSAFVYFAANSGISDPDDATYSGTNQWYNLMRGCIPRPEYPAGQPFYQSSGYASANGIVTTYSMAGDPVSRLGWVDGIDLQAGDRRIVNVHGPITLNLGDTAEVVIGLVYGMGADNLTSVKVMKYNTTFAQFAFNNLFKLPAPPPNPSVDVSRLDKKVILNWANENANTVETSNNSNFTFQGYNVYQLPSPSAAKADWVRIATYDVKGDNVTVIIAPVLDASSGVIVSAPVQFGSESGIKRTQTIDFDHIRQRPLINSQEYYYAVSAYSYNAEWNNPLSPFSSPFPSLESQPVILTVIPKTSNPGVRYTATSGQILTTVHTAVDTNIAKSDGSVVPNVVQPDKLTGHTYQVLFDATSAWRVVDNTLNNTVVLNGTNQSGDENYMIVDGIQVVVTGPAPGMKDFAIPSGTRRFSPVGGFYGLGLEGFSTAANPAAYDEANGTIGMAGHFAFGGIGTTLQSAGQYHTVLLKLATIDNTALWDPKAVPTDPNISRAYRWCRAVPTGGTPADPSFAPWIINRGSGYPYQDFDYGVPFSAWDMETNPPTRLAVGHFENNVVGGLVDGRYWPGITSVDNSIPREFCFIFNQPYSTTPDPAFQTNLSGNATLPMMWVMVCARRAEVAWAAGDEFEIDAAKINSVNDIFTFTSLAPTYDKETAKADVEKINVFPNPYYGFNARETNRLNKWVKFTHLPANTTIRIFNLAGVLVRSIPPTEVRDQFATWDLRNSHALPVASGIYIVHVDMPDLGTKKILKLAVVQEEQVLPTY